MLLGQIKLLENVLVRIVKSTSMSVLLLHVIYHLNLQILAFTIEASKTDSKKKLQLELGLFYGFRIFTTSS